VSAPRDRRALARDADFFLGEAARRLRLLAYLDGRNELLWRQTAALAHGSRVGIRKIATRERNRQRATARNGR
jgi:hypothetical protein